MNLLRKPALRIPVVAIGALAWFAISNHCAIAAVEGAAKMPMASCHGAMPAHHPPAKQNQKGDVECCKILRATLLTLSSNIAAYDTISFAAHDYVVAIVSAAERSQVRRVIEWDTGPPTAHSFAESVLQRSILAHAPPRLA